MFDVAAGRGRLRACAFFVFSVMACVAGGVDVFAADGDLDLTFAGSGRVLTDFSATDDYGQAVVIQSDGKILAAGQSGVYPLFHSALVRFNANGTLDTGFGTGGKAVIPLDPSGDGLSAVAVQPDGRIVVAGSQIHDNFTVGIIVARLNPNGTLDTTFGEGGSVIFDFGDLGAQGTSVVIQGDGKIIVAGITGTTGYGELTDIVVIRFNTDGSFDNSYGVGGRVRTHFVGVDNTGSRAWGAALQLDGRLVVAGAYKNEGTQREFALARYNTDGSLDQTFGIGGMVHTSLGAEAFAFDLAIQGDGRIVIAGYRYTAHHNHDFAVARYNVDGTLDATFGTGGIVISDLFGTSDDIASAIAIQTNGRIVVAGRTGQYPNFRPGLVRYNLNGTYDTTFGTGGKVMSDFGGFGAQVYGCALQRNGRIVVAGYLSGSTTDLLVARYMSSSVTRRVGTDVD